MEGCEREEKIKCRVVRSINLARHHHPRPDMELYNDCVPLPEPCVPMPDVQLEATCIKVCSKDEFKIRKGIVKLPAPRLPHRGHGKLMYGVKAGLLVGTIYFTYSQGIWGDQQELMECTKRWQEYMRSITTRRPPKYDVCGNVMMKYSSDADGVASPVYMLYKTYVTTCFAGIVKFPKVLKCLSVELHEAYEKKHAELALERKIRRKAKQLNSNPDNL